MFSILQLVSVLLLPLLAYAKPAPDDNSLLFFGPTTGDEAPLVSDTFTIVTLDAVQWAALTAADVATYRAVVLGDPNCIYNPTPLDPVVANRAVWSEAITGNVVLIGTDPSLHAESQPGAKTLMEKSIEFAAAEKDKTGLYLSLSCYYHDADETTIELLDQFGEFRVRGKLGCYNDIAIVAEHPALKDLTAPDLANWSCSVHEIFFSMPPDFAALAIARGVTGSGAGMFPGNVTGVPYIVARGIILKECGNGRIDPGEECDDGNVESGDGCSAVCKIEKDGPSDEGCEKCSPHPGENKCHVTTSCSATPYGTMCACRPGYKALGAGTDTSLHWRLKWSVTGHEHRVYVKPGAECNELCNEWYLGAAGCREITEVSECKGTPEKPECKE